MSSPDRAGGTTLEDGFFLERLATIYEKELADLRAFSQRECRSYDEIRLRIAEWHCKHLFSVCENGSDRIRSILCNISQALESLQHIGGLQSFFLVVDPNDPTDEGFLGGTVIGREFWRGHRGCGTAGTQAFKSRCLKSTQPQTQQLQTLLTTGSPNAISYAPVSTVQPIVPVLPKKGPASSLKSEVYSSVRNAVRVASGVRNAEMKWTNHSNLATYGIQLIGWPANVPMQNPSSLSVAQNREVLDAVTNGAMRFIPINSSNASTSESGVSRTALAAADHGVTHGEQDVFEDTVDFSWASGENNTSDSNEASQYTPQHEYQNQRINTPLQHFRMQEPEDSSIGNAYSIPNEDTSSPSSFKIWATEDPGLAKKRRRDSVTDKLHTRRLKPDES